MGSIAVTAVRWKPEATAERTVTACPSGHAASQRPADSHAAIGAWLGRRRTACSGWTSDVVAAERRPRRPT